jgi:murein endopeptidase
MKPIEFPMYRRSIKYGTLVEFTTPCEGTVVVGSAKHKLGLHSDLWVSAFNTVRWEPWEPPKPKRSVKDLR